MFFFSCHPLWYFLLCARLATHVCTVSWNGIYIIIFIDNSETTTWRNDIFSIGINIQYWFAVERHQRLDIYCDSCLVLLLHISMACSLLFFFFLFLPPAQHTHRNPIIPKQIFLCNRQHSPRLNKSLPSMDYLIKEIFNYQHSTDACSIIFIDYVWGLEYLEFCFDGKNIIRFHTHTHTNAHTQIYPHVYEHLKCITINDFLKNLSLGLIFSNNSRLKQNERVNSPVTSDACINIWWLHVNLMSKVLPL